MSELREDPTTGYRVVIAPERLRRPVGLKPRGVPGIPPQACPFCPGVEERSGPTLDAVGDGTSWTARAVANRYPALRLENGHGARSEGLLRSWGGFGAHEVLVETPEHDGALWNQGERRTLDALRLARARHRDLYGDPRLEVLYWFRNHGLDGGSSQPHPHAQLCGLPEWPDVHIRLHQRFEEHWRRTRRPLFATLLDQELASGARVVLERSRVTALTAYAPRAPFEVWLVPRPPAPHFREASDETLEELARVMRAMHRAIERALGPVGQNAYLLTAPRSLGAAPSWTWHVRLRPRLEPGGGFELGTGGALVSTSPEEAAQVLRARMA